MHNIHKVWKCILCYKRWDPLLIGNTKQMLGGREEGKPGPQPICRAAGDDGLASVESEPVGELRVGDRRK